MLKLITSPNPLLLEVCEPCDPSDKSLKKLSNDMLKVMYKYQGIGLAGPQVGVLKRIVVIDNSYDPEDKDVPKEPIILINPVITEKSEEMHESDEGCLSCPGVSAPVIRHNNVSVKYTDLDGKEQSIKAEGTLSRCLQHEIDHLDGKTLFQTAKPDVRLQLLQEYQNLQA